MTVDLHSHSLFSDGQLSPSDLVARASEKGVTTLALTDHDSVSGVPEAQAAGAVHGITIIPALELSTLWNGMNVHVVGLGVDIHHPALVAGLAVQATARSRRAKLIAEKLERNGLKGAYEAALERAGSPDTVSRTHFAQWMMESGRVQRMQQAFDKYLGQGKSADVPIPWMGMEEGIALIHAAGGISVLAHPVQYRMTRTKLRKLVKAFADAGGRGLEVSTGTQAPDTIPWMGLVANEFGLLASQGSDYHGPHMPWIELGRFLPLPAGCRPVWDAW